MKKKLKVKQVYNKHILPRQFPHIMEYLLADKTAVICFLFTCDTTRLNIDVIRSKMSVHYLELIKSALKPALTS